MLRLRRLWGGELEEFSKVAVVVGVRGRRALLLAHHASLRLRGWEAADVLKVTCHHLMSALSNCCLICTICTNIS